MTVAGPMLVEHIAATVLIVTLVVLVMAALLKWIVSGGED